MNQGSLEKNGNSLGKVGEFQKFPLNGMAKAVL